MNMWFRWKGLKARPTGMKPTGPTARSTPTTAEGEQTMTRVGLYPGTFDPIHNGHLDLIRRALKLVDRLVIGVAINSGKGPMFNLEEREEILRAEIARLDGGDRIEVHPYSGLTVTAAREVGA